MTRLACLIAVVVSTVLLASLAWAGPVVIPDSAPGHPNLQTVYAAAPNDGVYASQIRDGLPPGTALEGTMRIRASGGTSIPGGILGGTQVFGFFDVFVDLSLDGTGSLAGFHRDLSLPAIGNLIIDTAPRVPGQPVQSFNTALYALQAQAPGGDPDFDLLRVVGGNAFGLPSPGHTTLTAVPGGWNVDSFFDITYRIDFIGSPGSQLAGHSGSTTNTGHFTEGQPIVPEPTTLALLALGGLALIRRKRARRIG